jgi:hypothetical protein
VSIFRNKERPYSEFLSSNRMGRMALQITGLSSLLAGWNRESLTALMAFFIKSGPGRLQGFHRDRAASFVNGHTKDHDGLLPELPGQARIFGQDLASESRTVGSTQFGIDRTSSSLPSPESSPLGPVPAPLEPPSPDAANPCADPAFPVESSTESQAESGAGGDEASMRHGSGGGAGLLVDSPGLPTGRDCVGTSFTLPSRHNLSRTRRDQADIYPGTFYMDHASRNQNKGGDDGHMKK